jgi:prolyl-tRNA synthetase
MKKLFTSNAKSIQEVCEFLKTDAKHTCKAVCYAVVGDENRIIIAFIRGDKEINEAKLKKIVGCEIAVKDLEGTNLVKGNIGCLNLNIPNAEIYYDTSLEGLENFITGANKKDYHISGVSMTRDVKPNNFVEISKVNDGDICAVCGEKLSVKRGIEVGNIFQLGTKYTKTMGLTVSMPDGSTINPIMGCYGIGVGRCLASIAEESCDEKGLVWPMSIAPWHIYLCPLRNDDENIKNIADKLYEEMNKEGFEVIYDDRVASAGVKFKDSELMGIPVRVVISPRSLENNEAEITIRETGEKFMISLSDLKDKLREIINV